MPEMPVQKPVQGVAEAGAQTPSPPAERSRHPLLTLRQEMDRLFDDFLGGFTLAPFGRGLEGDPWGRFRGAFGIAYPTVDAAETEQEYQITAELPGMTEKDVEVTLANGMLTLKGAKNEVKEERKKDYFMSERRYGSFQRSVRLPDDADPDKVAATLKNGVLMIVVPKTAQAQPEHRKVEIKAA